MDFCHDSRFRVTSAALLRSSRCLCRLLAVMFLLFATIAQAQPNGKSLDEGSGLPPGALSTPGPPPSAPLSPVPRTAPATPVVPAVTPPGATSVSTVTPEIPDYHLTQVHLDAKVSADRVNLVATIDLMINRGEGWHRVPLRLGAAHVTQREYQGDGSDSPDVSPRATDEGLVWLFKGVGRHQLKLHAWIPLKPATSGGQFQLSLPRLPPQFEARVRVEIPDPNAIVRSTKMLTVLDVVRGEKTTTIDASVLGSQLQFVWQIPSVVGETISLVQSWFHLKPTTEHLSLLVEQNFELQQTTAESLLVKLPADFRLTQVSGQNFRSYEMVPDRPDWVRVNFINDNAGRLQLRWVLERDFTPQAQTIQLEGFHVEGAIREEGLIRIDEFENLRLVPRQAESTLVHRTGVNLVRSLGSGVPLIAYEYLKQPFKLTFDLQPTAPYFVVDPTVSLRFEPEAMELTIRSAIRLERGVISELKLNWPDWLKRGWRIQSVNAEGESVGQVAYDATSQPGVLRLWWPNPLTQDAVISVVFRRAYSTGPGEEQAFRSSLQLPVPQASEVGPMELRVTAADQLSVDLSAQDGIPLVPVPPQANVKAGASAEGQTAGGARLYRLEDSDQKLQVQIQSHQREISAVTEISVEDGGSSRLAVEQKIDLHVAYGRIRTLELALPSALMEFIPDWAVTQGIQVTENGRKLPLQAGSAPNFIRIDLGEDRIGSIELFVSYAYPIPDERGTVNVDLPVVALNNIPFSRAECLIESLETMQVRPGQSEWESLQTSPKQARWINPLRSGPLISIPLTIGHQLADLSQQYVVQSLQVRTIFSSEGTAESWAEFQLDHPPGRVLIQFPPATWFKEQAFLLDGEPLPASAISRRSSDSEEVTITLPAKLSTHPRLSVRYRTTLDRPLGLTNRIQLPLPTFPKSVWVDKTIWEMQLPQDQHLFTYPELVPQIQWVRNFVFWHRRATSAYLAERAEMNTPDVPQEFQFQDGTFFAFRGFGPVQKIEFQTMNRSLILLLGAGLTLLVGFVFWRLPATRNVFSLIVISFAFAVAGLWYVEPILLLLQPAALGVLLALTATIVDSTSRSRGVDQSSHSSPILRSASKSPDDDSRRSAATRLYRPLSASKPKVPD